MEMTAKFTPATETTLAKITDNREPQVWGEDAELRRLWTKWLQQLATWSSAHDAHQAIDTQAQSKPEFQLGIAALEAIEEEEKKKLNALEDRLGNTQSEGPYGAAIKLAVAMHFGHHEDDERLMSAYEDVLKLVGIDLAEQARNADRHGEIAETICVNEMAEQRSKQFVGDLSDSSTEQLVTIYNTCEYAGDTWVSAMNMPRSRYYEGNTRVADLIDAEQSRLWWTQERIVQELRRREAPDCRQAIIETAQVLIDWYQISGEDDAGLYNDAMQLLMRISPAEDATKH